MVVPLPLSDQAYLHTVQSCPYLPGMDIGAPQGGGCTQRAPRVPSSRKACVGEGS